MSANDDIIKAKERWWAAKEAGDQAGMDAAHADAEAARAAGGTIGANEVTSVDQAHGSAYYAKNGNTMMGRQYTPNNVGHLLHASNRGDTNFAGMSSRGPVTSMPGMGGMTMPGMGGTAIPGWDAYFSNAEQSLLGELKIAQENSLLALNNQAAAAEADYRNFMESINNQKAEAHVQYKNQANAVDAMYYQNARNLEELLASEGVRGGGNISAQTSLMGDRQSSQAAITQEENAFNRDLGVQAAAAGRTYNSTLNQINAQIAQLERDGSQQSLNIVSQLEAEKAKMMMEQYNNDRTFALQEAGITGMYKGEKTFARMVEEIDLQLKELDLKTAPVLADLEIKKLQAQIQEAMASAASAGNAESLDMLNMLIKLEQLEGLEFDNMVNSTSKYQIMLGNMVNSISDRYSVDARGNEINIDVEMQLQNQINAWKAANEITPKMADYLSSTLPDVIRNDALYASDAYKAIIDRINAGSGEVNQPPAFVLAAREISNLKETDVALRDALLTYFPPEILQQINTGELSMEDIMNNNIPVGYSMGLGNLSQ